MELLPTPFRGRFLDAKLFASGGQGEIWCALDDVLQRPVALKVLKSDASESAKRLFQREIEVSAQLNHPAILPVHDSGMLIGDRPFLIMRFLPDTQTLDLARFDVGDPEVARRRRVGAVRRAAEALAHAHSRGVVHRDVKPKNIVMTEAGDVYVLDWGLAKVQEDLAITEPVVVFQSDETCVGEVGGSPPWMCPEAAHGALANLTPQADVFGLCATLYHLLTGAPPYVAADGAERLRLAREARWRPLPESEPRELRAIIERGLSREPEARQPNAAALVDQLSGWLDGVERRERARALVRATSRELSSAEVTAAQASSALERLQASLASLKPWEGEELRRPLWREIEAEEAKQREAEQLELRAEQGLRAALELAPELGEARERLADLYSRRLRDAELARRVELATRAESDLEACADPRYARLLKGDGEVTLLTDPPGARVWASRTIVRDRRMIEDKPELLGTTPLIRVSLPRGSYLFHIEREGHDTVRYPVSLQRGQHWDGVAPGDQAPQPIWLPPRGLLGEDEVYIPAGWFLAGDEDARNSVRLSRSWAEGFILQRYPVTNLQYLSFLNDLLQGGASEEEVMRWSPVDRDVPIADPLSRVFRRGPSGEIMAFPDHDGDLWPMDWPVFQVDFWCARRYAAWLSERQGAPWRLPRELEWEKAARGVDGRVFPWGDAPEVTFACLAESKPGRPLPDRISSFPHDVSPYGVRHMAGLARVWCEDLFQHTPTRLEALSPTETTPSQDLPQPYRSCRGGHWNGAPNLGRSGGRAGLPPDRRLGTMSIRLARAIPEMFRGR